MVVTPPTDPTPGCGINSGCAPTNFSIRNLVALYQLLVKKNIVMKPGRHVVEPQKFEDICEVHERDESSFTTLVQKNL